MNNKILQKVKLPEIYLRNQKEHYLDPIRQRLVMVTPEETVRQKIIPFLIDKLNIPYNMIRIEEPLAHYGVKTRIRADIIIEYFDDNDKILKPIAIIETKAPTVVLGNRELDQVFEYADILGCMYVTLSNGENFYHYIYSESEKSYLPIKNLPTYSDMLNGKYHPQVYDNSFQRYPYKDLSALIPILQNEWTFAPNSSREKLLHLANLYTCLMNTSHKLPINDYGIFQLIEDYGVRILTYGNASGYSYSNAYRSFLVCVNQNTQFVSIGINAYSDNRTIICVAIDDDKSSHHSLQLAIDTHMTIDKGYFCTFTHTGRIAVGHSGSSKASDLLKYVSTRIPKIIHNNIVWLGRLIDDSPWYMDDKAMIEFVSNLISYGIVRDEYRFKLDYKQR